MPKIISKLYKLKVQQVVKNTFKACDSSNIIQTLPLTLNLGRKVWIYWGKKR